MHLQIKHFYVILIVSMLAASSGFLLWVAHPDFKQQPENEIQAWTRGHLTEDSWVKYDKIPFVADSRLRKTEDIYFWVILSNATHEVVAETKVAPGFGPWGVPVSKLRNLYVYRDDDWLIFPFTINIPKAKSFFRKNESIKILEDETGWDTRYFKFKIKKNGRQEIQEWLLDEDTHIAEKVKVIVKRRNKQTRGYIMKAKESSFYVGDELRYTVTILGEASLIIGPIVTIVLINRVEKKDVVEKEEERFQSEEYKEKYLKKYEKKRSRRI